MLRELAESAPEDARQLPAWYERAREFEAMLRSDAGVLDAIHISSGIIPPTPTSEHTTTRIEPISRLRFWKSSSPSRRGRGPMRLADAASLGQTQRAFSNLVTRR